MKHRPAEANAKRKMKRFVLPNCTAAIGKKIFPFVEDNLPIHDVSLSGMCLRLEDVRLKQSDKALLQQLLRSNRDNLILVKGKGLATPLVFRAKIMRVVYRASEQKLLLGFTFVSAGNATWSEFTRLLRQTGRKRPRRREAA